MKIKHLAFSGLLFLILHNPNLTFIDTAQAFTCAEGGFSIWMPGEPYLQQVVHKTFVGNVKENTYTFKTENEKFGSSYTELPGIALAFLSDNSLFKKAKKSFLKKMGAQETSFEKIAFSGKEGRELGFQIPSENQANLTSGKARFYIFGKTLYVVMATAAQGAEGEALINRYLNSFKILTQTNTEISLNSSQKDFPTPFSASE